MHVSTLADQLRGLGHRVAVLCAPTSSLHRDAAEKNLTVCRFVPHGYFDPTAVIALGRLIRENHFDLIHAHYGKDLWTLVPALSGSPKLPLIFSKHVGTQKPKRDMFHRSIYHRVDRVLAISRVIAENLMATHPLHPAQVQLLHHGLNLQLYDDLAGARDRIRAEWCFDSNHFVIGTIGRLQDGKGHLEFLDMASVISREFPHTRFVIVGAPTFGEEHRARPIYEKVQRLALTDKVFFPGFRRDIPAVLSAMDLFAFPSRAEAFGLVLIEAMAAGKPVVSTRCDGVLDIVSDGENGLLYSPEQPQEFYAQVRRMLRDRPLCSRLAQNGRQTVEKKFSQERMLAELVQLYHTLLAKK